MSQLRVDKITNGSGEFSLLDGTFSKRAGSDSVAWAKTGNNTAEASQDLIVEVDGTVVKIPEGTTISMPTLAAGTDYAIWVNPDGTLQADTSFTVAPTAGGRRVGGFHYAPGGKASFSLNAGDGGTTAQIMDTSFYDLKWRPSVVDPRGLVLVGDGSFWAGMYHMSANHLTGPVHKYNVNPCRDGNPPQNITGAGNYPNARAHNLIESLLFHGFRVPSLWEFALMTYGTNELRSIGGSGPGLTGDVADRGKDQQTSAWGVFDATGVLWHWGSQITFGTSNVSVFDLARQGNSQVTDFFRLGGAWNSSNESGSLFNAHNPVLFTENTRGARGVCDHLILE